MRFTRTLGFRLFAIAIVVGGALYLANRRKQHRASAVIELVGGEAAAGVESLEVALRPAGDAEVMGTFRAPRATARPGGGLGRWPLAVPAGAYELTIDVEHARGRRTVRRRIEIEDTAVVHVDLAPDLADLAAGGAPAGPATPDAQPSAPPSSR